MPFSAVRVLSDREITIAGILADADGTLAQVGTGSFFVSRHKGKFKQVGGWGFSLVTIAVVLGLVVNSCD